MTAPAFSLRVDLSALDAQLDADADACEAAARPAAQAAIQVFYDEIRRRVVVGSKKSHYFYGSQYKKDGTRYGAGGISNQMGPIAPMAAGNLQRSIYQAYSKDESGKGYATYHASWNATKAPYGHLVEFGFVQRYEVTFDPKTKRFTTHRDRPLASPKQIAAKPFVRPAFAKAEEALNAAEQKYLTELETAGVTS